MKLHCYTESKIYDDYHNGKKPFESIDDISDIVPMSFYSCIKEKNNDPYSDWDLDNGLKMSMRDFDILLKEYLFTLYPIIDPDNGEEVSRFDYTSFNEISYDYWIKLIDMIENKAIPKASKKENKFYTEFLLWLEEALKSASIIVIDGAL